MPEQNGSPETISAGRMNYDAPRQPTATGGHYIGNAALPKPDNIIRDVQITQLNRGYVVAIGCQRFAIENASTLIAKLSEYILNPAATEQKWNEGELF